MNTEIQATVTHLSKEGNGRASISINDTLRTVDVPFTLPEETVLLSCSKKKGKKPIAKLIRIDSPSPKRVEARCPHFGVCGGCKLQHMSYEEALHFKEKRVFELFSAWEKEAQFFPIIASPKIWGYRNKMEFSFSQNKAGDRFLGLVMPNSRGKVFNLESCPIAPSWMSEGVRLVREFWQASNLLAYNYHDNTGHLRTLTFREGTSGDRMCILTVSGNANYAISHDVLEQFVEKVRPLAPAHEGHFSVILRIHQIAKGMKTELYEMKLVGEDLVREVVTVQGQEVEIHVSPQAFFQPNASTASILYEKALSLAQVSHEDVVYDLYCGTGSFGLACAHRVKQVVAIELSHDSAYDARCNGERLGLKNYTIIRGDVGTVLQDSSRDLPRPDVVFVDPPRSGLDGKALQAITCLMPKTILYVSCNPETQAQNIQSLCQSGYQLLLVQPIDQFPHTPHIENIAILYRCSSSHA